MGALRMTAAVAVGVAVGWVSGPAVPAEQVVRVEQVEVEPDPDVEVMCKAALDTPRWDGELEPLDERADCTIDLLAQLGWDVNVRTIGVVNDYADVRHGGPCAGLAYLLEHGRW
jgi:hypothetical protein